MRCPGKALRAIACLVAASAMLVAPARGARAAGAGPAMARRLAACAACHGKHGQGDRGRHGGVYPSLAGEPAGYLFRALRRLRSGERTGIPPALVMRRLLATLPEAYLRRIAAFYAGQPPRSRAVLPPRGASRRFARRVVRDGLPGARVPACTRCHGVRLRGREPATPALAGQYARYLEIQFAHWRQGARRDPLHRRLARALSVRQGRMLAAYLASRVPGPPAAAPVPAATGLRAVPAPPLRRRARLARGRYLARIGGCAACHSAPGRPSYSGGDAIDTPFGRFYAPNLTPDSKYGIGAWSEADFYRALHRGIAPGGRYLYPVFPFAAYTLLRRSDVDAIFAYLRSLPPVARPDRASEPSWPYAWRAMLRFWRWRYFAPGPYRPRTDRGPRWNRGAYLVRGLAHCGQCHTPRDAWGATSGARALAGGTIAVDGWLAPNITSNPHFGIGGWSAARLGRFLRSGRTAAGDAAGPMVRVIQGATQYLSSGDLASVVEYLRSVPGRRSRPAAARDAAAPHAAALGWRIYRHRCAACHGKRGEGKPGVYPALAANLLIRDPDPRNLRLMVVRGGFQAATRASPYPYSMPPFGVDLDSRQVDAVVAALRRRWGTPPHGEAASPGTPRVARGRPAALRVLLKGDGFEAPGALARRSEAALARASVRRASR